MLYYFKGTPTTNGPILTQYKTFKTIVSSSDEAKTGGIFENAQNVTPLHHLLETVFLNPQPKEGSTIITDNLTPIGILTNLIKP